MKYIYILNNYILNVCYVLTARADIKAVYTYIRRDHGPWSLLLSNIVNFSTLPKFKTSLFLVDLSKFLKYQLD